MHHAAHNFHAARAHQAASEAMSKSRSFDEMDMEEHGPSALSKLAHRKSRLADSHSGSTKERVQAHLDAAKAHDDAYSEYMGEGRSSAANSHGNEAGYHYGEARRLQAEAGPIRKSAQKGRIKRPATPHIDNLFNPDRTEKTPKMKRADTHSRKLIHATSGFKDDKYSTTSDHGTASIQHAAAARKQMNAGVKDLADEHNKLAVYHAQVREKKARMFYSSSDWKNRDRSKDGNEHGSWVGRQKAPTVNKAFDWTFAGEKGTTGSGKVIYARKHPSDYGKDFKADDHDDAAQHHREYAALHSQVGNYHVSERHAHFAEQHQIAADNMHGDENFGLPKRRRTKRSIKKSISELGTTNSGMPIEPAFSSPLQWIYAGLDPKTGIDDAATAIQTVTNDWTPQDHADHGAAYHALALTFANATPRDDRADICAAAAFMHFAASGINPAQEPILVKSLQGASSLRKNMRNWEEKRNGYKLVIGRGKTVHTDRSAFSPSYQHFTAEDHNVAAHHLSQLANANNDHRLARVADGHEFATYAKGRVGKRPADYKERRKQITPESRKDAEGSVAAKEHLMAISQRQWQEGRKWAGDTQRAAHEEAQRGSQKDSLSYRAANSSNHARTMSSLAVERGGSAFDHKSAAEAHLQAAVAHQYAGNKEDTYRHLHAASRHGDIAASTHPEHFSKFARMGHGGMDKIRKSEFGCPTITSPQGFKDNMDMKKISLEKASKRWGSVIGRTRGGTEVYSHLDPDHAHYAGLTPFEHDQAAEMHRTHADSQPYTSNRRAGDRAINSSIMARFHDKRGQKMGKSLRITLAKSKAGSGDDHPPIGKTKSGKDVYPHHKSSHPAYAGFSRDDHYDASNLHQKQILEHFTEAGYQTALNRRGRASKHIAAGEAHAELMQDHYRKFRG